MTLWAAYWGLHRGSISFEGPLFADALALRGGLKMFA